MTLGVRMGIAAVAASLATATAAQEAPTMGNEQAVLAVIEAMTGAFAAGDVEGVMETYAPGATVVGAPGRPVSGDADLRNMFAEFVASGVNFTYGQHEVVISGDTALHLMQWTAPSPDGSEGMESLSVAVLKRGEDGIWKMVIDHPFGDGVMQP